MICSYLRLETIFLQAELNITERIVSFSSQTYVDALNGLIPSNGQYRCTLKNGSNIVAGVSYNTLKDFESCSLINGGFKASGLSSTFNDTQQYVLSGYNGRCAVIYGPTADIPTQPLEEDPLSVGGKLFYRLGDTGCTPGQSVTSTHCM